LAASSRGTAKTLARAKAEKAARKRWPTIPRKRKRRQRCQRLDRNGRRGEKKPTLESSRTVRRERIKRQGSVCPVAVR